MRLLPLNSLTEFLLSTLLPETAFLETILNGTDLFVNFVFKFVTGQNLLRENSILVLNDADLLLDSLPENLTGHTVLWTFCRKT